VILRRAWFSILLAPVTATLAGCGSRSELLGLETTFVTNDASAPVPDAAPHADAGGSHVDASLPPSCSVARARVFVTSALYGANFGGLSGADARCSAHASSQGLGGRWRAWLSDSSHPASSRVYPAKNGYALLDGSVVAKSYRELLSGSISHPIDRTEANAPITDGNTEVWTGTGLGNDGNVGYCSDGSGRDWSSNGHMAPTPLVGHLDATDSSWTAVYLQFCDRTNVRIYCFEVCD
jgi:hypothetical protein